MSYARAIGCGAPSVSDVLAYRALWDDYVQQTVCALNVLSWATAQMAAGKPMPTTIDLTALPAIPYCSRTIPEWDVQGPLVDVTQFGDNPPTVTELQSVSTSAATEATALLNEWNVWAGLSSYEIVQDAPKILTQQQGTVLEAGKTDRATLARFAPGLSTAIIQGPRQSDQAQLIAQLEAAKIVAGATLTVMGFGVGGVIQTVQDLGDWTKQHAKNVVDQASGLLKFALSPWTIGIAGVLLVGSVGFAIYNADKLAKLTAAARPI